MNTTQLREDITIEEQELLELKQAKKAKRKRRMKLIDRIFGVFLATGIMFGVAGLALEYVLIKGPSPALRDTFVYTMLETRRFDFIPRIFLTEAEMHVYGAQKEISVGGEMDLSLIKVPGHDGSEDGTEAEDPSAQPQYNTVDEDGDGIIFEEIKGKNYVGYMITVLDPSRVFVGMPDESSGRGWRLDEMAEKYDALGGINAGGYIDEGGGGLGRYPDGLTMIGGVCYNEGYGEDSFVGFDENGVLHVGYMTAEVAKATPIRDGVTFHPIIIMNGELANSGALSTGMNPRSAIGQRADGAVLLLAIDGRQAHSAGATYQDVADIMLEHGAINACNLDGGSSTAMYYNGEYVGKCSSANGICRDLPTAFMFK